MYLHELKAKEDQLVVNSHGQCVVLTESGAVFENFFTDDLRNICIAFGRLFEGDWHVASSTELDAWKVKPAGPKLLSIDWNRPPPREPLHLVKAPGET